MKGRALGDVTGERMGRERKPAGRDRAVGRACMAVLAVAAVMLLMGIAVSPLAAQPYPNKPVHLILPFPPGGATDVLGRVVGQKYAERFGQPFVPENRPGAGGNIGAELVAKGKPDGYELLFVSPSLTISPGIYKKLNYDPVKDLAAVSLVMEGHYVLLVRPTLPVKSLKEFVEYAKARPGKVNFGGGIGTPPHLSGELLNTLAGIKMVLVPYKGVNQAMIGMMSNEIDMVIIGTPAALPQIKAGKVRPLAVLTKERLPSLPDVPTAAEAGVANYVVKSWYGVMAPAGTPRDIITLLNTEWAKIAAMPDTKEKTQKFGFDAVTTTPEQFAQYIKEEIERWGKVARDANIVPQ
ncbi:MAG: Bug family tripartite tricarboxylate transporter substrate binding protein [Syntrophales bacterium]